MTKEYIIEQAYIQILGGILHRDSNVERVDIENLLPPVMAQMFTNAVFQGKADSRNDYAASGFGSYTPPIEFYKEVVLTPVLDENTCVYYVQTPKLLDLPNMWNITTVRPKGSFNVDIIRVRSHSELIGAPATGQGFYWVTNNNGTHKLWLPNIGLPVQDIVVTAVISPDALEYTDEVPCPPSVEAAIIPILVETFRAQRATPSETII